MGATEKVWLAGQTVEVDVALGPTSGGFGCAPVLAESLRVEVTDPLNQDLPSISSIINQNPATARVRFTTRGAGYYHVNVIFEPNLGSAQTDVLVARDARNAKVTTLDMACVSLQRLVNGSLLCERMSGEYVLHRPDGTTVELPRFAGYVVAGEVLWGKRSDALIRLVDSGSGVPSESATLALPLAQGTSQMWASESELLVLFLDQLEHYTFNGAVIVKGAVTGTGPDALAFVRKGDAIFIALRHIRTEVQKHLLTANGFEKASTAPISLPGFLLAADGDGFWAGPRHREMTDSTTGAPVDTVTYFTETNGAMKSQLAFRVPRGFSGAMPYFLSWDSFTGSLPGVREGGEGVTTSGVLMMPVFDGKTLTFDLLSKTYSQSMRFGQMGNEAWVSDPATEETSVFKRGP